MFGSRFMVLMLLGSIVTGPQRAWLSGSPVAQSVIFMPGRLFQRCYANRWTSLTPQWTPPLPSALLFILASSCNEPSPAFYIFLRHFLLENGAAFENSAEILSFMQEPQILALVLSIPLVSMN